LRKNLQTTLNVGAGVVRSQISLKNAQVELESIEDQMVENEVYGQENIDFTSLELLHLLVVGRALVKTALQRDESRGCHTREDYPAPLDSQLGRYFTSHAAENILFVPLDPNK